MNDKPIAVLTGENENVFNLMSVCTNAMSALVIHQLNEGNL